MQFVASVSLFKMIIICWSATSRSAADALAFVRHYPMRAIGHSRSNAFRGRNTVPNHASIRFASAAVTVEETILFPEEDSPSCSVDAPLHPQELFNGTIPYPKSLSPSSISEFKNCPQSFLFQYLYGLKQPTGLALAKGSMCHAALEQIFDLQPQHRNLTTLQNLFRRTWSTHRLTDTYKFLFENDATRDLEAEAIWGREGLQLLENYWRLENASAVARPNPVQREVWVRANLTVDPSLGATAGNTANAVEGESFLVRGIVDRLDMVRAPDKEVALRIVDYKTGKAPQLKYTKEVNRRIEGEALYQLKVYALLLREKVARQLSPIDDDNLDDLSDSKSTAITLPVRFLRLFYLTSASGGGAFLDYDLGRTQGERDNELQNIHSDISNTWLQIIELVSRQDPKAFAGCDRSFCYCHKCRARFVPGTVWEPKRGLP